jgi:hypothetical protein
MTQPDDRGWEDIIATGTDGRGPEQTGTGRAGPFAGPTVDGYAFTQDAELPELRYQRQAQVAIPPPPRRELPRRIRDQVPVNGVWQPGGSARIRQPKVQTLRPSLVRALPSGLIPLALLGGGIYLVVRLYGLLGLASRGHGFPEV